MDSVVGSISELFGPIPTQFAYGNMQVAKPIANAVTESDILASLEHKVRYTAIPFLGRGVLLDDLMQEGRIALLRASRTWDPAHGVKLWTYARKFVLGAIIAFVSKEIEEPCRDVGDDEDAVGATASGDASPEDAAELREGLAILEEEIDSLNDDEKKVLWQLFGEGQTSRDAATTLHTSHATISRTKLNALEKLRARMEARS